MIFHPPIFRPSIFRPGIFPDALNRPVGDVPSLDLAFALDKTLTARRGPTPTFSRGSTGTFVGSNGLIQSAAINTPRFDHDPVTLACKGLLIEESRINSVTHSENMTVANGWSEDSNRILWVNNATTSPSGSVTAEKLTEASSVGVTRKISVKNVATVAGTTYVVSVYAKAAERSFLQLTASANFTSAFRNFDLVTGQIGGGNASSSIIEPMGNGWYRCSFIAQATATSSVGTITIGIVPDSSSSLFAAYQGVDGNGIFLWGAQLEAGSFPTSYIPTTTTALTRSADVCSITGEDFTSFYNQSEGTAVTKVTSAAGIGATTQYPFSFTASSAAELLFIFRSGSAGVIPKSCRFASIVANFDTLSDTPDAGVFADNATSLAGFAIKLNNFAGSLNGNLITDTTVSLPTVNRMIIGNRTDGTRPWNGHISRIQYFKKRLPDAKLQSLTTP